MNAPCPAPSLTSHLARHLARDVARDVPRDVARAVSRHLARHLARHLERHLFGALLALLGVLGAAVAPPAHAAGAIEQLKAFSRATQSARGEFSQQLVKRSGQASAPAKGEFAFARPGRFRWDIRSPYQQLIVTDGRQLFFYDRDLKQVTVRPAGDAIGATPAAVLFGSTDLDTAFTLEEAGEREGLSWVAAQPKAADSGFDSIRVGMRDGLPATMEVKDAFGQVNRFTFTRISRNAAVSDGDFSFTPPAGVDVIQ